MPKIIRGLSKNHPNIKLNTKMIEKMRGPSLFWGKAYQRLGDIGKISAVQHCVKSVEIRIYFYSVFSCSIGLNTEIYAVNHRI